MPDFNDSRGKGVSILPEELEDRPENGADQALKPRPRPRRRPQLPDSGISPQLKMQFVASVVRSGLGVVGLLVALLWLPAHMVTPIISGVSVLMVVSGAYTAWRTGVADHRLKRWAQVLIWTAVVATLGAFALNLILGPGAFAPTFEEMTS
jgi:hypothetical protein